MQGKEDGFAKLTRAAEAGEKLNPTTAPDGREAFRQQSRSLKHDWECLIDEMLSFQTELNVKLVQWRTFEECYAQSEIWLSNKETLLRPEAPLCAFLEDKKLQLQLYQVISTPANNSSFFISTEHVNIGV